MRKIVIFLVAGIFLLALLGWSATYSVRFTEAAVVTTFGRAGEDAKKTEPGLKFKWPAPIQSVTKYDTRTRFLQTRSETQQTADSRQLVVGAFCTWRVSDPLAFFQSFSSSGPSAADHYRKAEENLRGSLRSAMGEISKFRMGDLFATDAPTKLPDLEAAVLAALRRTESQGRTLSSYGIEITGVGVSRLELPEETSREAVNSMKSDRNRLIKDLESKGAADEKRITSIAENNARKIESFAQEYAEEIRRRGNLEAETYVKQMAEVPELAILLKNADFIRSVMAKHSTFIFSTGMPGWELASPAAAADVARGKAPSSGMLKENPMNALQPRPETVGGGR